MSNSIHLLKMHQDSFNINLYTVEPFRMIGLIDVDIAYTYGIERVTLAFYSSSGTNSGKIKDLWYPIVGIKTSTGPFIEFTDSLNLVLSHTTRNASAKNGWLAKSLFFYAKPDAPSQMRGFANGTYYTSLLEIGEALRNLYEFGEFNVLSSLNPVSLNSAVTSSKIYTGNSHTQKENYETYIKDLFIHAKSRSISSID